MASYIEINLDQAFDNGSVLGSSAYECLDCGSLVIDQTRHNNYHSMQESKHDYLINMVNSLRGYQHG